MKIYRSTKRMAANLSAPYLYARVKCGYVVEAWADVPGGQYRGRVGQELVGLSESELRERGFRLRPVWDSI